MIDKALWDIAEAVVEAETLAKISKQAALTPLTLFRPTKTCSYVRGKRLHSHVCVRKHHWLSLQP